MHFKRVDQSWLVIEAVSKIEGSLKVLAHRNLYSINEMCIELDCSQRHIYDVFIRDIGLSPQRWVRAQRMSVARRKLMGGASIRMVSEMLGYSCVVAFTRGFGRAHGMPPGRYLQKCASLVSGGEHSGADLGK